MQVATAVPVNNAHVVNIQQQTIVQAPAYTKPKVLNKIEQEQRDWKDRPFAFVYLIMFVAQIVLTLMFFGSAKDEDVLVEELSTEISKCSAGTLPADVTTTLSNIKSGIDTEIHRFQEIFGWLIFAMVTMCFGLVFFCKYCALVAVWGMIVLKCIVMGALGIWFAVELPDSYTIYITLLAYTAWTIFAAAFWNKEVSRSARILGQSLTAVTARPGILGVGLMLQCFTLGYYVLTVLGVLASYRTLIVNNCSIEEPSWVSGARAFNVFTLGWSLCQCEVVRLYACSVGMGYWYFEDPNEPTFPTLQGLKWGITSSLGTVSISGIILMIAEEIQDNAKRPMTCIGCCFWIMAMILKSCLQYLSKFVVVMSAVSGFSFSNSAEASFQLMKTCFVDGYISNRVAVNTLRGMSTLLSGIILIGCWALVDAQVYTGANAKEPFQDFQERMGDSFFLNAYWLSILSVMFFVFLMVYKLAGMLIMCYFAQWLVQVWGPGPIFGVFMGIIAGYVFTYMVDLMINLMEATFVFYAIDKSNGSTCKATKEISGFLAEMEDYVRLDEIQNVYTTTTTVTTIPYTQNAPVVAQAYVAQPGVAVIVAQPVVAQAYVAQPAVAVAQPYMNQPVAVAQALPPAYQGQPAQGQQYAQPTAPADKGVSM